MRSVIVITSLAVLLSKAAIAAAQSTPPAGITVPSTPPVDQTIPTPSQSPNLPPVTPTPTPSPSLETPPTPAPFEPPVPSGEGVLIKKIEIVGDPTVLQREIAEL